MSTSHERQAFGEKGGTLAVSGTGPVTGEFCALQFIEDTTLTSLNYPSLKGASNAIGLSFAAGSVLYGKIKGFEVNTGAVMAYNQSN